MTGPSRGMVLVIVVVFVAILTATIYGFADRMLMEQRAVRYATQRAQSRQALHSGTALVQTLLVDPPDVVSANGGWYNNPTRFANQMLPSSSSDSADTYRLSIVSPAMQETGNYQGLRYGLTDESSKLNLNTLIDRISDTVGQETPLMALPGMTQAIAHSILDWLDADDIPRASGAEADYYASLPQSYQPRNGKLESIEELLLVRGVTPALLFGKDQNRDGSVSDSEASMAMVAGGSNTVTTNTVASLDLGWHVYLTIWSNERQVTVGEETSKIDVNGADLQKLRTELEGVLDAEQAAFIIAYRMGDAYSGDQPGELLGDRLPNRQGGAKRSIESILDLVGARVQVTFPGRPQPSVIRSPFSAEPAEAAGYLDSLQDAVSVGSVGAGRINVNQAPYAVLATVQGLDASKISTILAQRMVDPTGANGAQRYPTWLFTQGVLTLDEMKLVYPFLTCAGHVYRTQVVGVHAHGIESRGDIVIDATQTPPRVVLWRDTTLAGGELGKWLSGGSQAGPNY